MEPTPEAPQADPTSAADQQEDRVKPTARRVAEWVAVIAAALALALLVRTFLFQAYFVQYTSMEPTLANGDRVIVNKLSYDVGDVNRGDVVVFKKTDRFRGTDDLIKRVIALEGETIQIKDGEVYIDGVLLEEPYLAEPGSTRTGGFPLCAQPLPNGDGCVLGDGQVFVMGDNRQFSSDSRNFGPISEGDIVGRAFVRIWPLSDFGWV